MAPAAEGAAGRDGAAVNTAEADPGRQREGMAATTALQRPLNAEPSTWLQLEKGMSQDQRGLFEPCPSLLEEKGPNPLPDTEPGRSEGAGAGAPGLWWPLC